MLDGPNKHPANGTTQGNLKSDAFLWELTVAKFVIDLSVEVDRLDAAIGHANDRDHDQQFDQGETTAA